MRAEASSRAQESAMPNRSFRLRAGSTPPLWRGRESVRAMTSLKPSRKFRVVVVEDLLRCTSRQRSPDALVGASAGRPRRRCGPPSACAPSAPPRQRIRPCTGASAATPSRRRSPPPSAARTAAPTRPGRTPAVATADLTVIALGRADASASRYIAEIQRRLERQDRVRYVLHAMGTSLEGTTEEILAIVAELHAVPFELGIPRVYSVLKLDERRDREQTLEDKVESVRRLLG